MTNADQLESAGELAAGTTALAITVLMHENACSADVAGAILRERAASNGLSLEELAGTIVSIAGSSPLHD